jgi:thioester reductase-like protein
LTGGTGFLGVFVIKELLTVTSAHITCLVREESDEAATERLINNLKAYFPDEQLDYDRLNGVKSDLTLPDLGLSELTGNIDTVYHMAANVSHFGKVEQTNKINFEGTVNLLEWAKRAGVGYFNHFSTTAVASGGNIENVASMDFYENDLNVGQDFGRTIYPASKFKAEQYISEHKGAMQVNVFRIGNIGGDTETGLFQKNIETNSFYQRLKTLASLKYYCDEILDYTFTTNPVDLVARMTVGISLHRNDTLDTFHIIESEPIRFEQVIRQLAKYHIILKRTDVDTFREYYEKLKTDTDTNYTTENTFLGILKYGLTGTPRTQFNLHDEATNRYLDKIGVTRSYDREDYAYTIIRYCIEKEFIKSVTPAL